MFAGDNINKLLLSLEKIRVLQFGEAFQPRADPNHEGNLSIPIPYPGKKTKLHSEQQQQNRDGIK